MLNLKCWDCYTEFLITSKIEKGTYINCSLCGKLVMDDFDWEKLKENKEED